MIFRLSIARLEKRFSRFPLTAETAWPPPGAEEALAMQLANPIASFISVPFNSTTTLTSVQWKTATDGLLT